MVKRSELRVPVPAAAEVDVLHPEPRLLPVAEEKGLLRMSDHEEPLVGENVRLREVSRSIGVDEAMEGGEVFAVVAVANVEHVLLLAQVVLEEKQSRFTRHGFAGYYTNKGIGANN